MKNSNNAMQLLECAVERMDFQEICYITGGQSGNRRDSKVGMNYALRDCFPIIIVLISTGERFVPWKRLTTQLLRVLSRKVSLLFIMLDHS